jgi:hypothetical protein
MTTRDNSNISAATARTTRVYESVSGKNLQLFIDLANKLFSGSGPWPEGGFDHGTCGREFRKLEWQIRKERNPFPRDDSSEARHDRYTIGLAIRETLQGLAINAVEGSGIVSVTTDFPLSKLCCFHIQPSLIPKAPIGRKHIERRPEPYEIEPCPKTHEALIWKSFVDACSGTRADRIRICPICERIYWVRRAHAQVCSVVCRVKQWRIENPEKWRDMQLRHESNRAEKERRTLVVLAERKRKRKRTKG